MRRTIDRRAFAARGLHEPGGPVTTQETSAAVATPNTDAAIFTKVSGSGRGADVVPADFARAQERRIAELEKSLRDVRGELEAYSGLRTEHQDWSDAFAVISKVLPR